MTPCNSVATREELVVMSTHVKASRLRFDVCKRMGNLSILHRSSRSYPSGSSTSFLPANRCFCGSTLLTLLPMPLAGLRHPCGSASRNCVTCVIALGTITVSGRSILKIDGTTYSS